MDPLREGMEQRQERGHAAEAWVFVEDLSSVAPYTRGKKKLFFLTILEIAFNENAGKNPCLCSSVLLKGAGEGLPTPMPGAGPALAPAGTTVDTYSLASWGTMPSGAGPSLRFTLPGQHGV